MSRFAAWGPFFLVFGLALIFVGERVIGGTDTARWLVSGLGVLQLVEALIVRVAERQARSGPARQAATVSLWGYVAVAVAMVLYAVVTFVIGGGDEAGASTGVLHAVWVAVMVCGLLVALVTDWARGGLQHPDRIEIGRVRAAAGGALTLGLAITWVFLLNYLGDQHDVRWGWSDVATVSAGDGTLELVENLGDDVEIVLFYPPGSDTLERIEPYFQGLAEASPRLTVSVLDQAVEPARATALGASGNGNIIIARGNERRSIPLAPTQKAARRRLKTLDREVQEALLKVTHERRTMSFTVGHGEREAATSSEGRAGTRGLRDWLRTLNVTVLELGMSQGLGREFDASAGIVSVVGPTDRFLPEEVESLRAWYRNGGSLLLMLDPDVETGLDPLLADLGLALASGVVCHDRYHLRESGGPADRATIVTNRFGTHPVAKTLARTSRTQYAIMETAGALRVTPGVTPAPVALVRPMAGSWLDLDGDRVKDDGEPTDVAMLAAAVATGEGTEAGRAVVIADSELIADGKINRANLQLATDALIWLARAGDPQLRVTDPVKDPPLVHTRDEDALWFWSTIAGVPLLVLGLGLGWVRRRRRSRGPQGGAR